MQFKARIIPWDKIRTAEGFWVLESWGHRKGGKPTSKIKKKSLKNEERMSLGRYRINIINASRKILKRTKIQKSYWPWYVSIDCAGGLNIPVWLLRNTGFCREAVQKASPESSAVSWLFPAGGWCLAVWQLPAGQAPATHVHWWFWRPGWSAWWYARITSGGTHITQTAHVSMVSLWVDTLICISSSVNVYTTDMGGWRAPAVILSEPLDLTCKLLWIMQP